jgi:hypothetical protein
MTTAGYQIATMFIESALRSFDARMKLVRLPLGATGEEEHTIVENRREACWRHCQSRVLFLLFLAAGF